MTWRKILLSALSGTICILSDVSNAASPLSVMSDKIPENFNVTPEVFSKSFFRNVSPDANEKKLGLIVGVIDNSQEINIEAPEEKPLPDKTIRRFIAQGEYSTGSFALECLKEQSEIKVSVSELKGVSGDSVKAENLKIFRVINHRQNPEYSGDMLINPELKNVSAGAVLQYCLFINVPENTKAGIYDGKIKISVQGGNIELPVKLRVMDFTLPEPSAVFGAYIPGHFFFKKTPSFSCWCPEFYTSDRLDMFFTFWKTRKFNSPTLCHYYPQWKTQDGNETAGFSTLRTFAESMKKTGLKGPMCLDTRFFSKWAVEKEKKEPAIKAEENFSKVIRELVSVAEKEKWPEMLYFPEEEIGNPGPIKIERYTRFWKVLREACGGKDYIVDNDIGYGRKNAVDRGNTDNFGIIQYSSWEEGALKKAKEAGRTVWIYNYGGFSRANYGFLMQKLGATGNHQWADMWYSPLPTAKRHNRVYSLFCTDGMISSVQYERVYEGINDYAHCYMLKELNKKLIEKGFREEARKNEEILAGILKNIPVERPSFQTWMKSTSDSELDTRRWTIAVAIENSKRKLDGKSSLPESTEGKTQIPVQASPVLQTSVPETSNSIIMAPLLPSDGKPETSKIKSYGKNNTGALKIRLCDEIRLKAASDSEEQYKKLSTPSYTCAWLAYNQSGLFISLRANHIGSGATWKAKYNDGDGELWMDDCMEFFFMLPGEKSFRQLIVNSKGSKVILYSGKKDFDAIEVSTKYLNPENKHAGSYDQEIFIPWKIFGLFEMPKPGTFWKLNVARGFNSKQQFYSWGRVHSSFHEADKWGTLSFTGKSASSLFEKTALSSCLPGMNSISGKIKLPGKYKNEKLVLKIFPPDGSVSAEQALVNESFRIDFNVPVLRKSQTWQLALLNSTDNSKIDTFEIPLSEIRKSVDVNAPPMKVISGDDLKLRIHANVSDSDISQYPLCMRAVSENNKTVDLPKTSLKSGGDNLLWFNTSGLELGKWKLYFWLDKMGGADENSFIEFLVLPSPYAENR